MNDHVSPNIAAILNSHSLHTPCVVMTEPAKTARLLSAIATAEDVIDPRSDAGVVPDPDDGGCAADCQPLTKRPVAPVGTCDILGAVRTITEQRIEIARVRGLYDAMGMLTVAGMLEAAELVGDAERKAVPKL